jgi:hypothetical protein
LGLAFAAKAQCSLHNVSVTFSTAGNSCTVTQLTSGKYNVSITRGSVQANTEVRVRAGSTDQIRFINITSNSIGTTWLFVGGLTSGTSLGSVDSITRFGTGADITLVELRTNGDIGAGLAGSDDAVYLDQANLVDVGGDVLDGITAIGSVGVLDDIRIGGDLIGPLTSTNSSINRVVVTGAIGPSGAVIIRSKGNLRFLKAASINANIDTKYNSGTGDLQFVETTSGSFTGSLNTRHIQGPNAGDGMSIAGNLNATVTVSEYVDELIDIGGSISSTGLIKIAKGLRTGSGNLGEIILGSGGLTGQVVINSGNATSSAWGGNVTVGATTLSPKPNYSQTNGANSIGAGAVGQVPFRQHVQDSSHSTPQFAGGQAVIKFYGPVQNNNSGTIPVIVEYDIGWGWIDTSSNYNYTTSGRTVTVTAINDLFENDQFVTFRIRPRSNLICDPSVITSGGTVGVDSAMSWVFIP